MTLIGVFLTGSVVKGLLKGQPNILSSVTTGTTFPNDAGTNCQPQTADLVPDHSSYFYTALDCVCVERTKKGSSITTRRRARNLKWEYEY